MNDKGHVGMIARAPGALPVVGHLLRVRNDPIGFLESMPPAAKLTGFALGSTEFVMVCDAELTQQILSDDRTFAKGGPFNDLLKELVGDGLFTCPHNQHRRDRRIIQSAFAPSRLPQYTERIIGGITTATAGWRDGDVLDVPVQMRRIAIHAAVSALFSGALTATAVDQLADDFTAFLVGAAQKVSRPPIFNRLPLPGLRRYQAAKRSMRETLRSVRHDRADGEAAQDVLEVLLRTDDEGHPLFSEDVAVDNAATFIAAPTATVASVLSWALHMMATRNDLADRLRKEADDVLDGGHTRFEHLSRLVFTRRFITETLRMYPTVWIMTRVVTRDSTLGGVPLQAGTVLTYSPYLLGRSALYGDPDRFDPDRWDTTHRPAPPRHAFAAFGGGARRCIGDRYSINEMVTILAMIAARWRLEPVHGTPLRPRCSVNLTPRALRLRLMQRVQAHQPQTVQALVPADRSTASGTRRPTRRKAWLV